MGSTAWTGTSFSSVKWGPFFNALPTFGGFCEAPMRCREATPWSIYKHGANTTHSRSPTAQWSVQSPKAQRAGQDIGAKAEVGAATRQLQSMYLQGVSGQPTGSTGPARRTKCRGATSADSGGQCTALQPSPAGHTQATRTVTSAVPVAAGPALVPSRLRSWDPRGLLVALWPHPLLPFCLVDTRANWSWTHSRSLGHS